MKNTVLPPRCFVSSMDLFAQKCLSKTHQSTDASVNKMVTILRKSQEFLRNNLLNPYETKYQVSSPF